MIPGISPEKHVLALSHVARYVLERHCIDACCIPATRGALDVLEQWGIPGKPLYTEAAAANAQWARGDREPPAWCVLISAEPPNDGVPTINVPLPDGRPGFHGHLVVVGKMGSRKYLLDMSAWQMDRPAKGIVVPRAVAIEVSKPFTGKWEVSGPLPGGGRLVYGAHPRAEGREWEASPNWNPAKSPEPYSEYRVNLRRRIAEDLREEAEARLLAARRTG